MFVFIQVILVGYNKKHIDIGTTLQVLRKHDVKQPPNHHRVTLSYLQLIVPDGVGVMETKHLHIRLLGTNFENVPIFDRCWEGINQCFEKRDYLQDTVTLLS